MVQSRVVTRENMRVLAFLPERRTITGVTFVRITGPYTELREQGYAADWMPYEYARASAKAGRREITSYDVYVFQRAGDIDGKLVELIGRLQAAGKKIVWETDDDYTNEHRHVLDADAVSVAGSADALTVSTPYLREQMSKHMGEGHPPIYLLQNTINFAFWDSVVWRRIVDGPTIGLVGTPTHGEDWKLALPAVKRILTERPDVTLIVGGYLPEYLQELPNVKFLSPVEYQYYPAMVRQIDIGLAPLVPDDQFNWSKSGIKAMEYWCSGAAVVSSDAVPYQRIANEDAMFLARDEQDWYTSITTLLDCPNLRRAMADNGREWVRAHRNMARNAAFWWDAYLELFK
jgi:glycosyltransferase involved in cell wall biosynthesis